MQKLMLTATVAIVSSTMFAQGVGRKVFKPGETGGEKVVEVRARDYNRSPENSGTSIAPIAIGVGAFGLPYGREWAIRGARINFGLPNWTASYESVYGLDLGLSGETYGAAGGVLINAIENTTCNMYGLSIAGLWNLAKGADSAALQLAAVYNGAEKLDGAQIGLINIARELHGVQLGIFNQAVNGSGLQIGIWNNSGRGVGSPILGFIY